MVDDDKPEIASEDTSQALGRKLGAMDRANIEEQTLLKARELGLDYIELAKYPVSQTALALIPREQARAGKTLCFLSTGRGMSIATVDPKSPVFQKLKRSLAEEYKQPIYTYLISEPTFQDVLKQYETLPAYSPQPTSVALSAEDVARFREQIKDFHDLHEALKTVSITDALAFIVAAALDGRASDIHIEPTDDGTKVRLRIDGILYTAAELDDELQQKVLTRIKLASHLKINVVDEPQDGHFVITLPDDSVDVRVSTVPAASGESVVMRLLRSSAAGLKLEDLGLRGDARDALVREVERPTGMIISCGPTGSGKTTLLYALLNRRNTPETKIITLEDPIEYRIPGLTQTEVDAEGEYTFAKALKASLRQDPDIIMVGEIRDLETAETAINAALTGHLVFSTLHTNSAAATVPRFLALKAKSFLLAPALNVVVGQRLVRRLCQSCKKEATLDAETSARVNAILADLPKGKEKNGPFTFYEGAGCGECQGLGYKGRIGLFEVMVVNDELEKALLEKSESVNANEIEQKAKEKGMITIVQDGLLKALDGITTTTEVFRVAEE